MSVLDMLEEMESHPTCLKVILMGLIDGEYNHACWMCNLDRQEIAHGNGNTLEAAVRACYDAWKESEK